MIKPTVGRVVWYWPSEDCKKDMPGMVQADPKQPMAATVAFVLDDRCVNLAVIDHNGQPFQRRFVTLLQGGEVPPANGSYAQWMPYQVGQAAKAPQVQEAQISAATLATTPKYPAGARAKKD